MSAPRPSFTLPSPSPKIPAEAPLNAAMTYDPRKLLDRRNANEVLGRPPAPSHATRQPLAAVAFGFADCMRW